MLIRAEIKNSLWPYFSLQREKQKTRLKNPMAICFYGEGNFHDHFGSKPMKCQLGRLNEPIPPFSNQASAKLSVVDL